MTAYPSHIRRRRRPIDEDMLRRLWPTMLTDYDIAERLGHDRGVIRRKAAKMGLPLRRFARRQLQAPERSQTVEHYSSRYPLIPFLASRGYSAERIAELAGCEVWVAKMVKFSGRF